MTGLLSRLFKTTPIIETQPEDILYQEVQRIKVKASDYVRKQVGNLNIPSLEIQALSKIKRFSNDTQLIKLIKSKLSGILPLLENGQLSFTTYVDLLGESNIVSALLQPFGNATEIMMFITYVANADNAQINEFISNHLSTVKPKDRKSVYYWIEALESDSLKAILRDYKNMRNIAAHSYQLISTEAAQSYIYRTYENIQRLELIINPLNN